MPEQVPAPPAVVALLQDATWRPTGPQHLSSTAPRWARAVRSTAGGATLIVLGVLQGIAVLATYPAYASMAALAYGVVAMVFSRGVKRYYHVPLSHLGTNLTARAVAAAGRQRRAAARAGTRSGRRSGPTPALRDLEVLLRREHVLAGQLGRSGDGATGTSRAAPSTVELLTLQIEAGAAVLAIEAAAPTR